MTFRPWVWLVVTGVCCGCGPGGMSAPPTVARCDSGANGCFSYDFAGGDTCTAASSAKQPDPAWEVITWAATDEVGASALQSMGWSCYGGTTGDACYLDHLCDPPAGHPDAFSVTCANATTHEPAPAPLECETTPLGVKLLVQPMTNLELWSGRLNAQQYVPGTKVVVSTVAWLPEGVSLQVGLDCGVDAHLTDRIGQSGPHIRGAGAWVVVAQSFPFDLDHTFCSGWGQILNAAEAPPDDGIGIAAEAYVGSYAVSGVSPPPQAAVSPELERD